MEVTAVEVRVVPDIRSLTHPASAVAIDFFKSPIFGAVGIVVSKMPFPEHRGGVFLLEMLAESDLVGANHRAAHDGVPNAGAVGPVAGHQGGPGGRAGRSDVVVGENGGL